MKDFVDRKSDFPNRRRLEIVSQTPNEIIADIYREEGNVEIEGTPIDATKMNELKAEIATKGAIITVDEVPQTSINFIADPQTQINSKIDKVTSANVGNIASFIIDGNIQDSGLVVEQIEQVETIYDRLSTDSTINWGYTSGIQGGVMITGKDFRKYRKLKVYGRFDTITTNLEIDLSQQASTPRSSDYPYVSSFGVSVQETDNNILNTYNGICRVNANKTSFDLYTIGFKGSGSMTLRNGHTAYTIYKIEGVY